MPNNVSPTEPILKISEFEHYLGPHAESIVDVVPTTNKPDTDFAIRTIKDDDGEVSLHPIHRSLAKVPRHLIVSAYINTAHDIKDFSEKDVIKYLRSRRISTGAARYAIEQHVGGHENFANRALDIAASIVWPHENKPSKQPTTIPTHRRITPEEWEAIHAEKRATSKKFSAAVSLFQFLRPESLVDMYRGVIGVLKPKELGLGILPIDETPFGDTTFNYSHSRYPLDAKVVSWRTISVNGEVNVLTTDEECIAFNALLIMGSAGLPPEALDILGISDPFTVIKSLRRKLNDDGKGLLVKRNKLVMLETNPNIARIRDKRTQTTLAKQRRAITAASR